MINDDEIGVTTIGSDFMSKGKLSGEKAPCISDPLANAVGQESTIWSCVISLPLSLKKETKHAGKQ